MGVVVGLLSEERARRKLRVAYRTSAIYRPGGRISVFDWPELGRALERFPSAVAVVDPYFDGPLREGLVAAVIAGTSSGVLAYGDFRGRPANDVVRLNARGVEHVVTFGVDDEPEHLTELIEAACGEDRIAGLIEGAGASLSWKQRVAVEWALREGWRQSSVEDMARAIGVHPRTLRRWFRDHDDLTPNRVLAWGRLLRAAIVRTDGTADRGYAIHRLGFANRWALRRTVFRLTGRRLDDCPPEELFSALARDFQRIVGGEE